MNKPSFINDLDYKLLCEKYPNEDDLKKVIEKIKNNYPVQYAIGDVPFYGLTINVDERALIPRPETEIMIDKIVSKLNKYNYIPQNILDLCTGSGCIALALKKTFPDALVEGVDISEDALSLAKENAVTNGLDVNYIRKDILNDFPLDKKVDMIVSNPPYVKLDEYVSPNTKYEPQNALYAGEDNLIFYKKILENVSKILTNRYLIAFEIGAYDSDKIVRIARDYFTESDISVEKDYAGFDRYIFISNIF